MQLVGITSFRYPLAEITVGTGIRIIAPVRSLRKPEMVGRIVHKICWAFEMEWVSRKAEIVLKLTFSD